ncbi:MAG: leucyl aminopeptidase [Deltaproteobacteria bacterium]|nr:MAG: leucyl aminopeptidase [Deltaproteobacteria bacterium]
MMKISIEKARVDKVKAEMVVVSVYEKDKLPGGEAGDLDKVLGGKIKDLIKKGDFKGKLSETTVIYTWGQIPAKRILLVGLGKRDEMTLERVRQVAGKAGTRIRGLGLKSFVTAIPETGKKLGFSQVSQAVVEGTLLALYRFRQFKTKEEDKTEIDRVTIICREPKKITEVKKGVELGQIVAEAANWTRDLVNLPGNELAPQRMGQEAQKMARQFGLKCKVLGLAEIRRLKMNCLLQVAKGSRQPPRFIILEYPGKGKRLKTVVLVGKGITFDSGGISIKPSARMEEMKYDMAGGAAVLGAVRAAAQLNLPFRIIALVPATENLPGGAAYKPGDILTSSGKTIEIITTDAEGRLILADALTYAQRYRPEAIIDLATLTGACIIALGHEASGMLGNNRRLLDRLKKAGEESGERVWELPLWKEYDELLKSEVADLKNVGNRSAGVITGGAFLGRFINKTPWAHLDIAGTAWVDKGKKYMSAGATGVGVRLLTRLFQNWAKK